MGGKEAIRVWLSGQPQPVERLGPGGQAIEEAGRDRWQRHPDLEARRPPGDRSEVHQAIQRSNERGGVPEASAEAQLGGQLGQDDDHGLALKEPIAEVSERY